MFRVSFRHVLTLGVAFALLAGCSKESKKAPSDPDDDDTGTSVSMVVATGEEAIVTNSAGVTLVVQSTTVPTDTEGNPGRLAFSVEPANVSATPPQGFAVVGAAWQLGPEGIQFADRCRVSMNAPEAAGGYMLGRLDPSTDQWEVVSTTIDPSSPERLWADALHLSTWAVLRSTSPGLSPTAYGAVRLQNTDGTRSISVCLKSYMLRYPGADTNFDPSAVGAIVAEAGHNGGNTGLRDDVNLILPQGDYVFELTRTTVLSLITPTAPDGWIETDTVKITTPWTFGTVPDVQLSLHPSGWTPPDLRTTSLRAPCEGTADHAFGTGDVQITLSWDAFVDLDLHVTEPSGEEIAYNHKVSATGGQLDRDRLCSNTQDGGPENVFWGTSGAPSGTYSVDVVCYSLCSVGSGSIPFRLRTIVDGAVRTHTGAVAYGERVSVTSFNR